MPCCATRAGVFWHGLFLALGVCLRGMHAQCPSMAADYGMLLHRAQGLDRSSVLQQGGLRQDKTCCPRPCKTMAVTASSAQDRLTSMIHTPTPKLDPCRLYFQNLSLQGILVRAGGKITKFNDQPCRQRSPTLRASPSNSCRRQSQQGQGRAVRFGPSETAGVGPVDETPDLVTPGAVLRGLRTPRLEL